MLTAVLAIKDSERRHTTNMVAALGQIAANKCRFIVGGRVKTTTVTIAPATASPDLSIVNTFETCSTIMQLPYSEITGAGLKAGTETGATTTTSAVLAAGAAQQPPAQQEEECTVAEVLPQFIADMFVGLSEAQFRLDLSSTEIRNRTALAPAATAATAGAKDKAGMAACAAGDKA